MFKLLKFLKSYIKESVLGPLFKLIEALFDLIVPMIIANIIDNGIAFGDTSYIAKNCGYLILLGFAGLAFSVTAQYFAAKAAVGFCGDIRREFFRHIQSMGFTEIDTIGSSAMITRMTSDVNQVQNGVNLTLRLLLRSPFVVFGAMITAFTINKKISGIFALAILVLSIIVFGIMIVTIPLYKKVQNKLDGVLSLTKENLEGSRVIRAFRMEQGEVGEFEKRNNALTSAQKFTGRISALMNPLTYVIINLAIIWLIHTGSIEVHAGLMTQGAVVALYNYMSQILVELIKMASLIITITKTVACGNRIQAVLETKPEKIYSDCTKTVPESSDGYVVEIDNASLRYKNAAADSLENISLKVKKGETIGIIGGTGSGKTSLVNMIAGFYPVSDGSIKIDGINIRDYSENEIREKFGIVPQKATLFRGSIRDNIRWGNKSADDSEIMKAVKIAQAEDIVKNKEGGLDFEIEQNGRNLSGGQKQRLTIARAVVKNPEILILDDSASALDFATDAALRKSIRSECKNSTVFIVSQRASSVLYADKIVVLDDGRAVGIGTHDELISSCEVYKEIYESQFKKEDNQNG